MFRIGNYRKGSNLTLLNTIYHRPTKLADGKYSSDAIDLIIKDVDTDEKFLETIENPTYNYFTINDNVYVDHNLFFTEKENCTEHSVPFRDLLKDIAKRTGNLEFYKNNIYNRNFRGNEMLHTALRVMNSDSDIEDHYRWKFSREYNNSISTLYKSFLDIEVDTIDMAGDFVTPGECPINAVSFIDERTDTIHSFLLRNKNNPLIEEFERETYNHSLYVELKDFIRNAVGGQRMEEKYGLTNSTIKFYFFDEEIDLIRSVFRTINRLCPDILLAWNMRFDIPYIIERIKRLKYNPIDVMTHPDFKYKECYYYIDDRHQNEFEERTDYAKISGYTVYLDQLIHFASRRKGRSALKSYKLDYIGEITCGVKKLDYKHITQHLSELPYKDFKTFVFYNIMDTIVQKCIEKKVNDIGSAYNNVLLNNTRWSKIYRQTIYLHNRAIKSFYNEGFIMGNNCNKNNEKIKFPGAFVADPRLNSDYSKSTINGRPVSIYNNCDDFDFKSLYPSITSEFNMAPNTIIGYLNIPEPVFSYENRFRRPDIEYKRGGQFMDDIQSQNWIEFYHRWFGLPSYGEMYDNMIDYYTNKHRCNGKLYVHDSRGRVPVFEKVPEDNRVNPFIKISSERDEKIYKTLVEDKSDIIIPTFEFNEYSSFGDIFNKYKNLVYNGSKIEWK